VALDKNGVPYLKKGGYKVKREHYDTEYARSRRSKGSGGSQGSKGERADPPANARARPTP
jgi:hypothetical protein